MVSVYKCGSNVFFLQLLKSNLLFLRILILNCISSHKIYVTFAHNLCIFSSYFEDKDCQDKLLVIQCDSGDVNGTLIASAQFCIIQEHKQVEQNHERRKRNVVFVIQLPRKLGGCFSGLQVRIRNKYNLF
jgi:soluble P-type ATPase